jgi:hypothetical protein
MARLRGTGTCCRNGEAIPVLGFAVGFDNPESVDPLAVGIRERVEQDVIDDAEDRGGRTDSQAESGYRGEQKSMIFAQTPVAKRRSC